MSVHQCPAVGLADLECLPAVDGDVAAGFFCVRRCPAVLHYCL